MRYRTQKQIIIAFLSILVFSSTVFASALVLGGRGNAPKIIQPPPEVPEPVFKNIEVISADFLAVEKRDKIYDIVSKIKNPNLEYGSSHFVYEFIFIDKKGGEINKISGSSFILANQTRYIIKQGVRLPNEPARVALEILSQTWKRLAPFDLSGFEIDNLSIRRDTNLFATYVSGVVYNRTPYNLKEIEVYIALGDPAQAGKFIAAGTTNLQLINRGAARAFQILWPSVLPYVDIDAKVESNFFENDNFIRDYAL